MRIFGLFLILPLLTPAILCAEPLPKPPALLSAWGAQPDHTFVNPILPADYSDLDVIRVDKDFYAISSTFQFSPGVVILHSRDLVHWEILSHAVSDLTQIAPEMNWDKMNRYGRGIWAGAIRFHNQQYSIYFGTPDEGFFCTTAANPAGPWSPLHHVLAEKGWDDCCPFFDDDGTPWFVATHFSDNYKIHLFQMAPDALSLLPATDTVIHQSRGSEANKLYKINQQYYHFFSEVKPEGRVPMIERADSLKGPWEIHQLAHVNKKIDKEPNQGGFINLPDAPDKWYFLTHQGTGDWEGRAMCLLPVTWSDKWPLIGEPGADHIGNMVWQAPMPLTPLPAAPFPDSSEDHFDKPTLAPQWEWNYQPRADHFSLTERPGYLRLHAFQPLRADDLLAAGNTLTQRVLRTASNTATVHLDLAGMVDGQSAGLAHFAKSYTALTITQSKGTRTLAIKTPTKSTPGPTLSSPDLYLQTSWTFDGAATFSYSTDGKTFTQLGETFPLTWSYYRGDRLALFTYNNTADAGHIDVDSFRYTYAKSP